jgi:hypothetical protein
MVDEALGELWAAFEGLYSRVGRPSIPPEKLLRALLQVLYTIRSKLALFSLAWSASLLKVLPFKVSSS